MQAKPGDDMKMLLIDMCGEGAGVALSAGAVMAAEVGLRRGGGAGSGSAEVVGAIGRMLQGAGWSLQDLDAVSVVSGPGSFTGVRVGMATAKGLCEAAGVRMIAVSRLAVLADAVMLKDGFVALDAGRGELYVGECGTDTAWREWLGSVDELKTAVEGRAVFVAEAKAEEMLSEMHPAVHPIAMEDVLRTVLRQLVEGVEDMRLVDANYVRREGDIYSRPAAPRAERAAGKNL